MSSIRRLLTDQLVVRKLSTVSGYKTKYRATATVEGHVQKIDDERAQVLEMVAGQTFIGWLPVDLGFTPEIDNLITDGQGRVFQVKTATKYDFGINQHWELILERYNEQDI